MASKTMPANACIETFSASVVANSSVKLRRSNSFRLGKILLTMPDNIAKVINTNISLPGRSFRLAVLFTTMNFHLCFKYSHYLHMKNTSITLVSASVVGVLYLFWNACAISKSIVEFLLRSHCNSFTALTINKSSCFPPPNREFKIIEINCKKLPIDLYILWNNLFIRLGIGHNNKW